MQVWFQNTRARERKGQLRAHQQVINKRCPFCRALFKARTALESHLATRHADQYTRGEIDIDALPDSDSSDEQPTQSNAGNAQSNLLALAGLGLTGVQQNPFDEQAQLSNALTNLLTGNSSFAPGLGASNAVDSQLNSSMDSNTADLGAQMRQLLDFAALNGLTGALNNCNNNQESMDPTENQRNGLTRAETPLDLTKPVDL